MFGTMVVRGVAYVWYIVCLVVSGVVSCVFGSEYCGVRVV